MFNCSYKVTANPMWTTSTVEARIRIEAKRQLLAGQHARDDEKALAEEASLATGRAARYPANKEIFLEFGETLIAELTPRPATQAVIET